MKTAPLSEKHLGEIRRAAERALAQWLGADAPGGSPRDVVRALDRVLLFLRQNGSPSRQAGQVTSLALAWGEQVVKAAGWVWMNVGDEGFNPGLVAPGSAHACLPVDEVTLLVMEGGASLVAYFERVVHGPLPESAPGALLIVGAR